MTAAGLTARGLSFAAGSRTVLDDVGLDVEPGERVALVGPSGSGKTTLLALLGGLARPSAGSVLLDGREPERSEVAVVLQGYGLLPLLTATENVEVTLRAAGVRPVVARERAARALAELAVGEVGDHLVDELSGGHQQRVAVARALALGPRLVLADEPTAEQDAGHRALVLDALLGAAREAVTVVLATHDLESARRCDRTIEMTGGRLAPPAPSG